MSGTDNKTMRSDRELSLAYEEIAMLAIQEHEFWRARNTARTAFRDWLREYRMETDEYFDPSPDIGQEPELMAAYKTLCAAKDEAQTKFNSARRKTRSAIVRAAASIIDSKGE